MDFDIAKIIKNNDKRIQTKRRDKLKYSLQMGLGLGLGLKQERKGKICKNAAVNNNVDKMIFTPPQNGQLLTQIN